MLFGLQADVGDKIIFYVAPDGFSTIPSVRVLVDGAVALEMEANETREALATAGRHETGRCGFALDDALLPGLRAAADLEIVDPQTGVLIYRRAPPGALRRKLLRIETHLFPLWRLDFAFKPKMQHFQVQVERFGRETATQLLMLPLIESVYLSGQLLYRNFAHFIEAAGFDVYAVIHDPYEEFAERLMVLRQVGRPDGPRLFGAREAGLFAPAIAFAQEANLEDVGALRRAFRALAPEAARLLSNPLVRQFTVANPDDLPAGSAVASALDAFAGFKFVGLRAMDENLTGNLTAALGLDGAAIMAPAPMRYPAVTALADRLRASGAADDLLEKDNEFYYYVARAAKSVGP